MDTLKKKNRRKPLSLKSLLLLLAVLAAAAALLCYFLNRRPALLVPETTDADGQLLLFSYTEDQLLSVTITPPEGEAYTLLMRDGELTLESDADFPIRTTVLEDVLNNASHIQVETTVLSRDETDVSLSDFGLEPPACTAVLRYTDGTTHTLRLGDQMPADIPYYYMTVDDDPRIFGASTDTFDAFSQPLAALHPVDQPGIKGELIDSVDLAGENRFHLTRTVWGWQLNAPFSYPMDEDKADNLLTSLEGLRFARYIGMLADLTPSEYGLDAPRLTLTLDIAESVVQATDENGDTVQVTLPASQQVFYIGRDMNEDYLYVSLGGVVYAAPRFLYRFLNQFSPASSLLAYPVDQGVQTLTGITFIQKDVETHYAIRLLERLTENNEIAVDEDGNTLYDVHVDRNGQEIDSEPFLRWLLQLRRLTGDGVLTEDDFLPQSADASLILYGDGISRRVDFYRYDSLYTVFAVDGTARYYLATDTLNALLAWPGDAADGS